MRQKVTLPQLHKLMRALGTEVREKGRVYLVGGATAVLLGWRDSTIDVDLKIIPDDEILKSLPKIKENLQINIELASPDDFIPELPGWQERSLFIQREGQLEFFHYDLYAQALAKIERGHSNDVSDVRQMVERGLVDRGRLVDLFTKIEDRLYQYPAVDPASFRKAVETVVNESTTG